VAEAVLDPEALAELRALGAADPEFVPTCLRLFLHAVPERAGALQAGATAGDAGALRAAAHALRGSAQYIGARALVERCRRVEQLARAGDLAGATAECEEIGPELARVVAGVNAELER
jgi:two-component system, sensor histidine kinase and response regulator